MSRSVLVQTPALGVSDGAFDGATAPASAPLRQRGPDADPDACPDRVASPARRRALFGARDLALAGLAAPTLAAAQPLGAATAPGAGSFSTPALRVMHGFTDHQTTTLWLQGRQALRLRVECRRAPAAAPTAASAPPATPPSPAEGPALQAVALDAANDWVAHVRLSALEPGTAYQYAVKDEASGETLAQGTVRTPVYWHFRAEPPTLRIAVGSCAYLNDGRYDRPGTPYGAGEDIFDRIADAAPDLMLWLGDNIYLRESEWTSREGMNRRHRFYREHPRLQKLMQATPHLALWDDHDFGPNNSDASFSNAAWAREMFLRYWPMPYAVPADAMYGQVTLGDVDLFLLDDRSHRDPNDWPDGPDKTMFGRAQMAWLKRALVASKAPFKLVATGGQLFNLAGTTESWAVLYANEHRALLDWLQQAKVSGLIFLTGDRHFAELLRVERPGRYPLHELTTSPLTSGPVRKPDAAEVNNPAIVPGTRLYNQRNFAMLTVSGPRRDRELWVELKDTAGKTVWDWRVKASALTA